MNEDDDWEELDENAMEECMVLATQLCSQQPSHSTAAAAAHNNNHHLKTQYYTSFGEANSGRPSDFINNGNLGSVNDSGMGNSRSNMWHPSISNSSRNSVIPGSTGSNVHQSAATSTTGGHKKGMPQSSYRSRFSDFSTTKNRDLHQSSLTRKTFNLGRGQVPQGTITKDSPSKAQSLGESLARTDASEGNAHSLLCEAQEEKKKLGERIITMQGEISLLRSELKRKETALEAERLDHCAAIEAAEKRGREKVAKQAAETDTKLKEKEVLLDKLQGELHFKKREVEELLKRCHQLEQQPELSHTAGPANKRPRIERKSIDSSILSRFDFGVQGAVKRCSVEVQTESPALQSVQRKRLQVAVPRGEDCQPRIIAALLSSCTQKAEVATSSVSSTPHAASSGAADRWTLPSEWLSLLSYGLRKTDENVEHKLVHLAVDRLQQVHASISDDGDRGCHTSDDPTEWYENLVNPAIQILLHFKSSSELSPLQAIAAHLPPLKCKDVVVNRRMLVKLLEAAGMALKHVKFHIERTHCEELVSLLTQCCGIIECGTEARTLLRLTSALTPHSQLCFGSGSCLIGLLCKKVKKLCVADLETLKALLDLTWGIVKVAPAASCVTSPCPCSSQLLGTFLWHMYQVLESPHISAKERKMFLVLASCIQVLHHWSVIDPDWWEKVSHFSHYPVLMVNIAAKAKTFDRDTVDRLCDLFEFEEGTFER